MAGCGRHLEPLCFAVASGFCRLDHDRAGAGRHPPSLSMNLHLVTRANRPLGVAARGPGAQVADGVRAAGLRRLLVLPGSPPIALWVRRILPYPMWARGTGATPVPRAPQLESALRVRHAASEVLEVVFLKRDHVFGRPCGDGSELVPILPATRTIMAVASCDSARPRHAGVSSRPATVASARSAMLLDHLFHRDPAPLETTLAVHDPQDRLGDLIQLAGLSSSFTGTPDSRIANTEKTCGTATARTLRT